MTAHAFAIKYLLTPPAYLALPVVPQISASDLFTMSSDRVETLGYPICSTETGWRKAIEEISKRLIGDVAKVHEESSQVWPLIAQLRRKAWLTLGSLAWHA